MPVIDLQFLISDKMKALHGEWKELKGKYAEVLKAKNISFDKKLGPMLDKRYTLHKQISSFKKGGSALIVTGQLNAFKSNAKAVKAAVTAYQAKVKGLGSPAAGEFGTMLAMLSKAAANDIVWAEQKLAILKAPAKK